MYKRPVGYNREAMRRRYERRRAYIESLKANPCADCGGTFPPECMDFDHLGDKFKNLARLMSYSLERIKEELAKCELVCANCHRIRTRKRATHSPLV
jgi:hypothetical protein